MTFHDSSPLTQERRIIDCPIHDPDSGGRSKRDQMRIMLTNLVHWQHLPFIGLLMNPWHATRESVVSNVLHDESFVLQRASQRLRR
ncbi:MULTISPECIES: hypothetical protein [Paraburkholderia]|uniref:hypothetical protein n=1 Tax=Paraburkholderia TaxID=1822464 RepID=UPI0019090762|nr:hypothetical protein [Paraburkholderia aspalathi]MBK3844045.1 hypothetical protein [Paraburkholderia aspalathi]